MANWVIKRPSYGDHIRIMRAGGLYYHHGIYLNDNEVICYSGEPFKQKEARILIYPLKQFIGDSLYRYVEVDISKYKYSSRHIVERAKSRIGERKYNLVFNNCEHFANWCCHGNNSSKQVVTAIDFVIAGIKLFARHH